MGCAIHKVSADDHTVERMVKLSAKPFERVREEREALVGIRRQYAVRIGAKERVCRAPEVQVAQV